jgi:hypothetical protein
MVFGRCFETALGAYFRREDPSAVLFKEWGAFRDTQFEYKKGDSWDRLVHQGVHLLQKFAQDDRVRIHRPQESLQVKMLRTLSGNNDFVAYIDALGALDGREYLIDWKTTTARYPEIQYLKASISEEQRREFGRLVETTVGQVEAGQFPTHSGIRFPQNACMSCSHLGLCLNDKKMVDANLIRRPGASDLDWLNELVD